MAERVDLPLGAADRREAPLRPAGDVLEVDALDRRLGAEPQDLLGRRLDQAGSHAQTLPPAVA